ncbi:hypothetical protein [Pseudorhodoplanes sp.]|uniref:hypothetical protein n=1 Tax=Pseudorhodoplanes sp. TaxID=1934341 RepID=UPI002BA86A91|nr:hypothetical protein [Pseudorhodoplanes sp.]HWV55666.1 hypothetical protein [Pseudorhodoplanes sp.]
MSRQKAIYIVCSPRQRVGKTLIARALTEFILADGRAAIAFDVNPNNAALYGFLPRNTARADIETTRGQMALFDELIAEDEVVKVIDLGDQAFDKFFRLLRQIGLAEEARRRGIDVVTLFIGDPDPRSADSYAQTHRAIPQLSLVPVHNEFIANMQDYMESFPSPVPGERPVRFLVLSPFLKSIVDRPGFSFDDYLDRHTGARTELHEWIERVFVEFRELELRLLLRELKTSIALR